MSLNNILSIGASGLIAAQNQLSVISDNITNVNTPGYVRKTLAQQSRTVQGVGAGVTTGQVQLATDKYLQQTSLDASSSAAQYAAFSELIDNIQSQFGNLTDSGSLFNQASTTMASLSTLAETPTSTTQKQIALSNMQGFFDEASRISGQIQSVRAEADQRILNNVNEINDLVKNISDLNSTISSAHVSGADATGALSSQSQYIDKLSKLIDIKVDSDGNGATTVRTTSGMILAGSSYAALSYQPAGNVTATTAFNPIYIVGANGATRDLSDHITSGELKGLLDLRDREAPAISAQLSQYISSFADAANAAHNNSTAVPAPNSLTGKNTSQTQFEGLTGLGGITNFSVLDAQGKVQSNIELDFTNLTYTADDGASSGTFSLANFANDINAATAGAVTVSFNNGAMTLSATNPAYGIAVTDDPSNPSDKNGQSFAQVFGLNDLITSTAPTNYQTGLSSISNHGFTAGDTVSFVINDSKGSHLADVDFAIPAGTDMQSLIDGLNDPATGLGKYGTFSLDSSGTLSFAGSGTSPAQLYVSSDETRRYSNGASMSQFFGLGGASNKRAELFSINNAVRSNSALLATATVSLTVPIGSQAVAVGDGTGATNLAKIGSTNRYIPAAGHNPGVTTNLDAYASNLAGLVGSLAASAESRKSASEAIYNEASSRRSSAEGVNLDEELVKMQTFQQAYSASSRIIQAAKDMYDVLLNMV